MPFQVEKVESKGIDSFKRELGVSLSNSLNKRELISIFKKKLFQAVLKKNEENAPQDYLKLFDNLVDSDVVKKLNSSRKRHYFSSRVTDCLDL